MHRLFLTLAAALAACGLLAGPAAAAPDRTFTLSASQTTAAWDGAGAFGVTPLGIYQCRAGGVYNCDDSLFNLADAGTLKATAEVDNPDYLLSLAVHKATADGAPEGDPISESELGASVTVVAKDLAPGAYVVRLAFRLAANANFTAKASLTPKVEAPPAVTQPVVTAAPAPKPAAKKKPSCKAKARKIKNAKKRKAAMKRCARRAKKG